MTYIIGHIFYAFGAIIILKHVFQILGFGEIYRLNDWMFRYREVMGREPKKEDFRSKNEIELMESSKALFIFEILWTLAGLFSASWPVFATVLAGSILIGFMLKSFAFTFFGKSASMVLILAKFFIYLLLIANHFYYHLDMWEIFKSQI